MELVVREVAAREVGVEAAVPVVGADQGAVDLEAEEVVAVVEDNVFKSASMRNSS